MLDDIIQRSKYNYMMAGLQDLMMVWLHYYMENDCLMTRLLNERILGRTDQGRIYKRTYLKTDVSNNGRI